ncbi:MAG: hypothetical protein WC974_09575 [Thermoplasmata archaeon]
MRTIFPNIKRREFRDDYEISDFINASKGMVVSKDVTTGDLGSMVEGESRISKDRNAAVIKADGKLFKQVVDKSFNVVFEELV